MDGLAGSRTLWLDYEDVVKDSTPVRVLPAHDRDCRLCCYCVGRVPRREPCATGRNPRARRT